MLHVTACVTVQLRVLRTVPGCWIRHLTSSVAAAHTGLQAVLVAGSALEGFEGIREAVTKHGHLAAMAHWARDEGEAPTGLARLGLLYPLETWRGKYLHYRLDMQHLILTPEMSTFIKQNRTGYLFCPKAKPNVFELQHF